MKIARITSRMVLVSESAAFPAFLSALYFFKTDFASLIFSLFSFLESDLKSFKAAFTVSSVGAVAATGVGSASTAADAGAAIREATRAAATKRVMIFFMIVCFSDGNTA